MRERSRGTMVTVATTGQLVCKHQHCFTLSQRNSVWLNSTSDSSSAACFVLAPTTNPNLLSDRQTESQKSSNSKHRSNREAAQNH